MTVSLGKTSLRMVNTVRRMRHERGWTQAQLAQEAGISTQAVVFVEAGRGCRDDVKVRLAEALGAHVHELFRSERAA